MPAFVLPRSPRAGAAIVFAGIFLAGCSGGPTPSTPTQPTATVTALSVSQPPGPLKAGDTFQFVATATMSDGRTATTGFELRWATSDEAIATVSATGLVTARADGSAKITASAAATTASVTVQIRTGGRTLTGLVTEAAPTFDTPVAGARITVVDGPYQGATATGDERGRFSLSDVNGVVTVRVSAANYEDAEVTADSGASLVVRLMPVQRMVEDSADWVRPSPEARSYQGVLRFAQHRTGPAHLRSGASIFTSDSTPTCNELRDDDNHLVWELSASWQWTADVTLTLAGGKWYTLKVYDCYAGTWPYPTLNAYALRAEHPY